MKIFTQAFDFKTLTVLLLIIVVTPLPNHSEAGLIDWSRGEIDNILAKVKNARDKAGEIKNNTGGVKGVAQIVKDNIDTLTGDVLDAVETARNTASELITTELTEARIFIGNDDCALFSPCDDFRKNLVTLLDDLAEIYNVLIQIDETTAALALQMDFSKIKQLVEAAPGMSLYPLYRAMTATGDLFASGILDMTDNLKQDLEVARVLLNDTDPLQSGLPGAAQFRYANLPASDSCSYVLTVPNAVRALSFKLLQYAISLKMVGKILSAAGETLVLGGPKEVGVHGYFKINFHDNPDKKWGTRIDAVADLIGKISVAIDNKLIYCTAIGQRIRLLQVLEDALAAGDISIPEDPDSTTDDGTNTANGGGGGGSINLIDIILLMMLSSLFLSRHRRY